MVSTNRLFLALLSIALFALPCAAFGQKTRVQIGNGFIARWDERTDINVVVGTTFAVSIEDRVSGSKNAPVLSWDSLTPDVVEATGPEKGLFLAKRVGTTILRARVYTGHVGPISREEPITRTALVAVTVLPIRKVVERGAPCFLAVGVPSTVTFESYRSSTDSKDSLRSEKNKTLDELPRRSVRWGMRQQMQAQFGEDQPQNGKEPSTREAAVSRLAVDLPLTIESLTPDRLLVAAEGRSFAEKIELGAKGPISLKGLTTGPARLRVICGGLESEFTYTVADPVLELSVDKETPVEGDHVTLQAELQDKETGKVIQIDPECVQSLLLEAKLTEPNAKSSSILGSKTGPKAQFTFEIGDGKDGDYKLEVTVVGLSDVTSKLKVRARLKVLAIDAPTEISIVRNDTQLTPLKFIHGSKSVGGLVKDDINLTTVRADDGTAIDSLAQIVQNDKGELSLKVSAPSMTPYRCQLSVDGQATASILVSPEAQLEIRTSRLTNREASDLFGAQVAKEFIIRELTFTNRLKDVKENKEIADKPIQVDGTSLQTHVIAVRDIKASTKETVQAAIHKAEYMWDTTMPSEDRRRKQKCYEDDFEAFFWAGKPSNQKPDNEALVLRFAPTLQTKLNQTIDAINGRRSEDVLERIFKMADLVTTFAAGLPNDGDLIGLLGRRLTPRGARNPFFGDSAATRKTLATTLFNGVMEIQKGIRAKTGKALSAGSILTDSFTVSSDSPEKRYLFISRASLGAVTGRKSPVILDLVDRSITVDYNVVTTSKASANSSGPGSK